MKITIVNTSDIRGGAAIAAYRLYKIISQKHPSSRMLVGEKLSDTAGIIDLNKSELRRALRFIRFVLERITFIVISKSRKVWFDFSPANYGQNISSHPEIKTADIINLHWINSGFLAIRDIKSIVRTGKPIIWSLHDMNTFTGGCHHAGQCTYYTQNCGNCIFVKSPSDKDLSYRVYQRKAKAYEGGNFTFIAVSNWMAERAIKSSLIGNHRIEVIPNFIDINIFKPIDKTLVRDELGFPKDKFILLFGAAKLNDKRKGFEYLIKALVEMKKLRPEISDKYILVTYGKSNWEDTLPVMHYPQFYIKDERMVAKLFQAADLYITPTIEDNLPTTVMESLGCGTPVVAFNTGGIPDMLDHRINGYIAEQKNIFDLINGITWVESHPNIREIRENCRIKAVENFSPDVISEKYLKLCSSLLRT